MPAPCTKSFPTKVRASRALHQKFPHKGSSFPCSAQAHPGSHVIRVSASSRPAPGSDIALVCPYCVWRPFPTALGGHHTGSHRLSPRGGGALSSPWPGSELLSLFSQLAAAGYSVAYGTLESPSAQELPEPKERRTGSTRPHSDW